MVSGSLVAGTKPGSAAAMPSLMASRDTTGHPRAVPTAYASVVLPDPAGPVTRTSVGRPKPASGLDFGLLRLSHLGEQADLLELVGQRRPVRRVQPRHLRPVRRRLLAQ